MQAMIELRVDNIITDHPERLVKLLHERQSLTNVERLLLNFHQRMKEN
jgi:hypothetical protein